MAYPTGITLRTVNVGGATALESGEPLTVTVRFAASRPLIWGATGWRFPSVAYEVAGTVGNEISVDLPITDQAGWRTNSNQVIDVAAAGSYTHTYTATISTTANGRVVSRDVIGPFALPADDLSPVDLDLMLPVGTQAGGVVQVPDTWSARLDALEAGGTGTGSGVQSVSGAVDLGTTPGLYEVYALDDATVEGVALAAGDAAVFRYLSGSWSWMIVGQHTTWQAPEPTAVTATAPTFTDADGTANDRYVIPSTTGVEYRKGGTTIAAGTYTPTAGESVTITAVALAGYTLTGTTSWSKTFSTSTAPISVTATAPTWTDDATNGGGSWSTPTITGVTYSPASGTATPGQSVTVTATAQNGYQLTGAASWTHAFPAAPGQSFTGATDNLDDAPDGSIVGRTTQTGGLTWGAGTAADYVAATAVIGTPTAAGGVLTSGSAILTAPQTAMSIAFDYTIAYGTGNIARVCVASDQSAPLMVQINASDNAQGVFKAYNGSSELGFVSMNGKMSGRAVVSYDGAALVLTVDGVQIFSHAVAGKTGKRVGIQLPKTAGIATVDNIEVTAL